MTDPGLSNLLKWSIENSSSSSNPSTQPSTQGLDAAALRQLLGGPSEADLMKSALGTIHTATAPLDSKLTAFDTLHTLIESLDNANLLAPLGLWPELTALLDADEAELRRAAAECVGTAVQNNRPAQEALWGLRDGAVLSRLLAMCGADGDALVRRKAVRAVSSMVRNFQPALDVVVAAVGGETVDAGDMEAVDGVVGRLREEAGTGR